MSAEALQPPGAQSAEAQVKAEVRRFYDSIGWQQIGEGLYQNARYEDLRPVSREYLHRCHRRVGRFLPAGGEYLLDAGSGPIQYPEYLEYSSGFRHRVCLDLSRQALVEARRRIGTHGLFVIGDVADLPFRQHAFEGVVSLHTVHHLPLDEHERAFRGFHRMLGPGGRAVVVYSWGQDSPLMKVCRPLIRLADALLGVLRRMRQGQDNAPAGHDGAQALLTAHGTHTFRHDHAWMRAHLSDLPGLEIRVWRTVSTPFLRALIHRPLGGTLWLRLLFWLEERSPRLLGKLGQYPMIVFAGPAGGRQE